MALQNNGEGGNVASEDRLRKFTFSDALNSLATARTGQEELQALHEEITQVPWQILKKALEKTCIQDKPPSWFTLDESRLIVCELRQAQQAAPKANPINVAEQERLCVELAATVANCTTPSEKNVAPPHVPLPNIPGLHHPAHNLGLPLPFAGAGHPVNSPEADFNEQLTLFERDFAAWFDPDNAL